MDELFLLTTTIFTLVLILSLLQLFVKNEKTYIYVRPAIYISLLIIFVSFIMKMDRLSFDSVEFPSEKVDKNTVWENVSNQSEEFIEQQILNLCESKNLKIDNVDVVIETDYKAFFIKSISISGVDKKVACNLVVDKYNINQSFVE